MIPFATRALRRLVRRPAQRPSPRHRSVHEGLPDGLDFETVNQICQHQFGERLETVSHVHLSGWKTSGAFRLRLGMSGRCHHTVIYKNAVYRLEEIPAVDGLPVRPGPPEYIVYRQGSGSFSDYLPAVYYCEEVVPGQHYRYLLEDVNTVYHPLSYRSPKIVNIAAGLPALHETMRRWAQDIGTDGLLKYGSAFSSALAVYVQTQLGRYQQVIKSSDVEQVLKNWRAISTIHLSPDFIVPDLLQPIHADYSPANIYVSKRIPIKILDWEWAGIGLPHADLASLLKRANPELEQKAFAAYSQQDRRLSGHEHHRWYEWCQLERGLLDAGYLAKQYLDTDQPAQKIPHYIEKSLQRALRAFKTLTNA